MPRLKKKWRHNKESEGCEFCGRRVSHIPGGGLEFAHIVAKSHFEKGDPGKAESNGFMLCPSCHKIFVKFIKPKIQACADWALSSKSKKTISKSICMNHEDFLNKLI